MDDTGNISSLYEENKKGIQNFVIKFYEKKSLARQGFRWEDNTDSFLLQTQLSYYTNHTNNHYALQHDGCKRVQ
jgi:hypothetical protein